MLGCQGGTEAPYAKPTSTSLSLSLIRRLASRYPLGRVNQNPNVVDSPSSSEVSPTGVGFRLDIHAPLLRNAVPLPPCSLFISLSLYRSLDIYLSIKGVCFSISFIWTDRRVQLLGLFCLLLQSRRDDVGRHARQQIKKSRDPSSSSESSTQMGGTAHLRPTPSIILSAHKVPPLVVSFDRRNKPSRDRAWRRLRIDHTRMERLLKALMPSRTVAKSMRI